MKPPELRHSRPTPYTAVFRAMGTVVSVRALPRMTSEIATHVQSLFAGLEDRFSLFRPDSEAARVASGKLSPDNASHAYRSMHATATEWSDLTKGAFQPRRPDGRVDLNGIVKACAIQAAGDWLSGQGLDGWMVNAGGDVWAQGISSRGRPWLTGIIDPTNKRDFISQHQHSPARPAIATSGTSERGEHIWRQPSQGCYQQVSVVAPNIITADVLATAIMAGGRHTLDMAVSRWPIEVLACEGAGRYCATRAFCTH